MIKIAHTAQEITASYPVLEQQRTHLIIESFVDQVQDLIAHGYILAYLEDRGQVVSVAGFKIDRNLYAGKHLYVEDLVTLDTMRSRGYGEAMMDWLLDYARNHQCQVLHLDSGVQRFAAHRFYLKQRMDIVSHHFLIKLA